MNKNGRYREHIYWGITAFCVIAASLGLNYLLQNAAWVKMHLINLTRILMPVIYGAVMAYLLTPVYNWCTRKTKDYFVKITKSQKRGTNAAKVLSTVVSVLLLILVVAGLFSMLMPQLIKSITGILESLPANITNFNLWLERMLSGFSEDTQQGIYHYINELVVGAKNWFTEVLVPNLNTILSTISERVFSALNWVKNILIGVFVMVYLLNMKESMVSIAKKIAYSLLPVKAANRFIEEVRYVHKIFGGFIIGKLLDSLIIGIICFLAMNLMRMHYPLLISVIIGVTNVIPFFGPFIGAIPSAFLIILVDPMQCLYFLIFILLLQQFDGNVLGPKILGDSTGVSSFWVLFSILLFGGLFGFIGMVIGVPTFAVIYRLVSNTVSASLRRKNLPVNTEVYREAASIDTETLEIKKNSQAKDEPAKQEKKNKA